MTQKDYYNILGVSKTASQDEIKKAFRQAAHKYHPDKKGGDEAKFKEINEAYQVLGNEKKRSQYDSLGHSAYQQAGQAGGAGRGGFGGFNDFRNGGVEFDMDDLGDMFGGFGDIFGFGGGGRSKKSGRGADLETQINLSFEEAVFGVEKEIKLTRKVVCDRCQGNKAEPGSKIETCSTCGGSGRVSRVQRTIFGNMQVQVTCSICQGEGKTYTKKCSKCGGLGVYNQTDTIKVSIPAGINDQETLRMTGQGEAGIDGQASGDLYLRIRVSPHKEFKREGSDIWSKKEITFKQVTLGDKIGVATIHGQVNLKIPAGTQSGTVFRLRGKGVKRLDNRGSGDHYVEIIVNIPTSLNRKQKKQIEALEL